MPHKDKFFSSFTTIKKEDWDKIFGSPDPYRIRIEDPRIDDPNFYEPQCLTQESS